MFFKSISRKKENGKVVDFRKFSNSRKCRWESFFLNSPGKCLIWTQSLLKAVRLPKSYNVFIHRVLLKDIKLLETVISNALTEYSKEACDTGRVLFSITLKHKTLKS